MILDASFYPETLPMKTTSPLIRVVLLLLCMGMLLPFLAGQARGGEVVVDVTALPTAEHWSLKYRKPDSMEVFKTTSQGELKLHVFLPPEGTPDASPRGALVLFHGGGWAQGKAQGLYWQANTLASKGMVVFCAEYRLSREHGTTPFECVADAKSAIRFVRANAAKWNIDPNHIAAGGGSAGGHIAACTAMLKGFEDADDPNPQASSRPDALVLWNPVLDTSAKGFGARRVGDNPEQLSPLHQVAGDIPPTIIFNGSADPTAKITAARAMDAKLEALGGESTLVTYTDEVHAFFYKGKGEGRCFVDTLARAEAFLRAHGFLQDQEPGSDE